MLLVLPAVAVPHRAIESKAAGEWHAAGWRGSRSFECGRSLSEARATGSGVGTHRAKGHQLLFIVVSRVAPTKGDLLVGTRDEPMVGDGHAMGVAAEILEHILRATERWF